jgi:hypothetical protein
MVDDCHMRAAYLKGSQGRWGWIVASPVLPLLVASALYAVTLTDGLFGDEFLQYRWSVLARRSYGLSHALDINTQLGRIGYLLIKEPWAMRLHSVLFSLGSIVLIWLLAKRCFDRKTAMLAAWVASLSPYLIEFATEARPNAISIFAGTLFLYALVLFLQNETWRNTLFLTFSVGFGLLAREMFLAILSFGLGYYVMRQKRVTLKLTLVSLATIPFAIRIWYRMIVYSDFLPKESSDASASALNFLARLPMAFTYGYCTLDYPDRDVGWNISISEVLSQNTASVVIVVVVFSALVVGSLHLLKKAESEAVFLVGAVVVPIGILLAIQKAGFSLLNEKHCAGAVGAYCLLLAAIMVQISRFHWGKCVVVLYAYLVGVSLSHFYLQPEIYSRRSNYTALNSFLQDTLENADCLVCYHWSSENQPNPFTVFERANSCVDMFRDRPDGMSLAEYVASVSASCSGTIYLIYDSRARLLVDPSNCVLPFLKKHRDFAVKRYGHNLLLYEFPKIRERHSR